MSNSDDEPVEEDPATAPDSDDAPETSVDTQDADTAGESTDTGEAGEAATEDSSESGEQIEISDGDFVTLSYTIRTVEDATVVDTTDEEVAAAENLETEERDFSPRTIVLGGNYLFQAVEDDIIGKTVGGAGSVTIPAEEAFGEFDPEEVRTISANRIPEDDRQPGAQVTIDGDQGMVETVIGGRARVDFNHPLAGEDLEYEYEIEGVVEDRLERAQTILSTHLEMQLDISIDVEEEEEVVQDEEEDTEHTETVEYETLYIEATPQLTMNQQWMFSKQQIADELQNRIGVDRVVVREVLDGGGMMGGMGGMMGGGMGDVDEEELESAIEDVDLDEDVDADEVLESLDTEE